MFESKRLQELEATVRSLQTAMAEQVSREKQVTGSLEKRVEELERRVGNGPLKGQTVLKEPEPQDVEDCQMNTCKGEEPKALLEHCMGATVWDSCAILGLPEVGWASSVLLLVNVLVNVFVQTFLSITLLANPTFRNKHQFRDMVPHLERWRLSAGHSYNELDASGSTLVARVCNADPALSVAGSQVSLLDEINAYLSLSEDQLDPDGLSIGAFVCGVCLFLFLVLMFKELRSTFITALAFIQLPRGSSTRIESGEFVALSLTRLCVIMLIVAVRIAIAVVLLYAGVMWLASTSSKTDLILNAAALGFIMDLDEMLFETTVPLHVQNLVRNLAPLKVRRPPLDVEAIGPLIMGVVGVTSCMYLFVLPNMQDMKHVKDVLCGGDLDFVVTTNPVGFVISRNTTPYSEASEEPTREQLAVRELMTYREEYGIANYSSLYFKERYFVLEKDTTQKQFAEGLLCDDLDTYRDGEILKRAPAWFIAVREMTKLHSGLTLAEQPFSCADHERFCDDVAVLRSICPVTCGCASPTSGLFLIGPVHGCPSSCEPVREQRMSNLSCIDVDATSMPGWVRFWRGHAEFFNSVTAPQPGQESYGDRQVENGCANRELEFTGTDYCNREHLFHQEQGAGTILGFCPATCCSGPEPPPNCPTDCQASG